MDKKMFYSSTPAENRCIGHLRADFGGTGREYHSSWYSHTAEKYNDAHFRKVFNATVKELHKNLLKNRASMRKYIRENPTDILEYNPDVHGYMKEVDKYEFYIRCTPEPGYYDAYIYCYIKEV